MVGSDGKEYHFLLKGNEDLRQDERAMQILRLINDLFKNDSSLTQDSLKIVTFSVVPLSTNCGIISWINGAETIQDIIKNYREKLKNKVARAGEIEVIKEYIHFRHSYDSLPKLKKLELYSVVMMNTRADDLKKYFWLNTQTADEWLTQRTNYIKSLAVMSIVGYILGLGDRHLCNIMIQKSSGKVVHIDFGDCFEVTRKREKLPEKVPFRLTRVLIEAMEACGIHGTFKLTCEIVMKLLRDNKDSLLAILEEFIIGMCFIFLMKMYFLSNLKIL
jgi:FKBP12-rapamycin complex-associated protein